MKRYACVHGHFYQPPRENPWTGAVERQPSAGCDHDWNARIARECYVPNGQARVVDGEGRITDIVDNYALISFNYGPTLLSWLEKAEPEAYARLLESDRASAARFGGHGNAFAQAFHHAILPLCSPRDRATEIRWGLFDFKKRFGRDAEGLWLPECAADDATLAAAAAQGVKLVILEPHQADSVRAAADAPWKPAADALKPGVPYEWTDGEASLTLYFYDGPLSRSVAFEKSMKDSRAFAARVAERVPGEDGVALLATDGESYGHHDAFAEMGLAHFLKYALPAAGAEPVNLAWHASKHPAKAQVRLRPGGTSWSCAHGIERWRSACGCGEVAGGTLEWRAPLRAALEGLRDRFESVIESSSAGLIPDPWGARDAYVSVVLDRSEANVDAFLAAWAPGAKDEAARVTALTILELQRHALMMFTSCGWFFDALDRLEPVQVLLYAARALELSRALGAGDLETEFVAALKDPSGVWDKRVKPQIVTPDHVAAHYAVSLLFEDLAPDSVHHHGVVDAKFTRRVEAGVTVAAGRATFVDGCTRARWTRTFFAAVLKGQRVQTYVCAEELPPQRFEALVRAAAGGAEPGPLPEGRVFLLRDLRPDEREKVLTAVLKRRLARWEATGRDQVEDALSLAETFRGLGLPLPAGLDEETTTALSHALAGAAERFAGDQFGALDEVKSVAARAKAAGVPVPSARAEEPFARGVERLLTGLENGAASEAAEELVAAAEAAMAAGLTSWVPGAQVRVFRWLKKGTVPVTAARLAELLALKP